MALSVIRDKLNRHSNISYTETEISISVPPESSEGFEVTIRESGDNHIVSFDGWHEEFSDSTDAINCFGFGLTNRCRLKVDLKGSRPYRWTMQYFEHESWNDDSVVGLLAFQFWQRSSVQYLQNQHISADA